METSSHENSLQGILPRLQYEYRDLKDESLRNQIVNFRLRIDQLHRFLCQPHRTPKPIIDKQMEMLQERLDDLREILDSRYL